MRPHRGAHKHRRDHEIGCLAEVLDYMALLERERDSLPTLEQRRIVDFARISECGDDTDKRSPSRVSQS